MLFRSVPGSRSDASSSHEPNWRNPAELAVAIDAVVDAVAGGLAPLRTSPLPFPCAKAPAAANTTRAAAADTRTNERVEVVDMAPIST